MARKSLKGKAINKVGAQEDEPALRRRSAKLVRLLDNSSSLIPVLDILDVPARRDRAADASRLAFQFIDRNRASLDHADVIAEPFFDGREVFMRFHAGNTIGAIPLTSPTNGKEEAGLVIAPRFSWVGLGEMLDQMGWRIVPHILSARSFAGCDAELPLWVFAALILNRLRSLMTSMRRSFKTVMEVKQSPRGSVRWTEYAFRSVAVGKFLSVPCTYPDLREDELLLGAIRFCLEQLTTSLQTQATQGQFVKRLIALTDTSLMKLQHVCSFRPSLAQLEKWSRQSLRIPLYIEGIEALKWCISSNGLGGVGNLRGSPWVMEMDKFFEAWSETIFEKVGHLTGATLSVGRLRQTVHPIAWEPPYLGSQRALIPDLRLEWGSITLIADVKYKRHFEELQIHNWQQAEGEWKEQHRQDLLQALAYANLSSSQTIISCLIYPCEPATWTRLKEEGKLFHKAEIVIEGKTIKLWLTAFPMTSLADVVAQQLVYELNPILRLDE